MGVVDSVALYTDFTFTRFRDCPAFRDMNGLITIHNPPENLVHAWRQRMRPEVNAEEIAYDIWIHVYDLGFYKTFQTDKGMPRFIYEADVFIQRDSDSGPSVNLKYAVKSPEEAQEIAWTVWTSLGCPTHS